MNNAATKFAGYAIALAATFAIAWGTGAAVGPETSNVPHEHPAAPSPVPTADHPDHAPELGHHQ